MTPLFFGTAGRRLFGLYTPGQGTPGSHRAAVLCHPWGQEYLRAHRSMRHFAALLARAGIHSLRFDYFGTGDSEGDMTDGDLKGWMGDIETAIDELKDMTGATVVGLAGLRLGATLAAHVAAKRTDVAPLVLWDPVVLGQEYMRELRRTLLSSSGPPTPTPPPNAPKTSNGRIDVFGFPLTRALAQEISAVDLPAIAPTLPARTLIIVSEPLSSHDLLRSSLARGRQDALPFEERKCEPAWLEERNLGVGAIPVKILERAAGWFG